MVSAAPMTKAKLGSQLPEISKNDITFAGLIICETVRPQPNKTPAKRHEIEIFILYSTNDFY
jgi:hypothetical protein